MSKIDDTREPDYDYEEVPSKNMGYLPGDILRHTSGELFTVTTGGAVVPLDGFKNFAYVASAAPEAVDRIVMDAAVALEEDMHMNDIIAEEIDFAKRTGVTFVEEKKETLSEYMMSPKGIKIVHSVSKF